MAAVKFCSKLTFNCCNAFSIKVYIFETIQTHRKLFEHEKSDFKQLTFVITNFTKYLLIVILVKYVNRKSFVAIVMSTWPVRIGSYHSFLRLCALYSCLY